MTAYNWDDIREEAERVGVKYLLEKPLFADNITEKLERIVRRSDLAGLKKKNRARLEGRRILLAEDVELNAEIMMDKLEMENIQTDHAANGKIAVELFEKSTAGIYSAILMNVRMPQMDGLEAARTIRAMNREDAKRIPIIALTANTFEEDVQLSLQAGMNAHLNKPVEADLLIQTLGELIYESESSLYGC
jgi:CheY-like chemotaxis protein